MIKKSEIIEALRDCYDPCCRDRGISVVDMGLIENVKVCLLYTSDAADEG